MYFKSIFLRERLIRYFVDRRSNNKHRTLLGRGYSVRELLLDIAYSQDLQLDSNSPVGDSNHAEIEDQFILKHDSLERFIGRSQMITRDYILTTIGSFLVQEGYVSVKEMEHIAQSESAQSPIQLHLRNVKSEFLLKDGEYVALQDRDGLRWFSSLLIRRESRSKEIRASHLIYSRAIGTSRVDWSHVDRSALSLPLVEIESKSGQFHSDQSGKWVLLLLDHLDNFCITPVKKLDPSSFSIILDTFPDNHILFEHSGIKISDMTLFFAAPKAFGRGEATFGGYHAGPRDFEDREGNDDWISEIPEAPDFLRPARVSVFDRIRNKEKEKDKLKEHFYRYYGVDGLDLNREFMEAARRCDLPAALQMLLCGADIKFIEQISGNTALHLAASCQDYELHGVLSGRIFYESPVVEEFFYTLKDIWLPRDAIQRYLQSIIEESPVSKKNASGLTPAAYLGPVDLFDSEEPSTTIKERWRSAVEFEAKHFSRNRLVSDPSSYFDYAVDNEFGEFMPFLRAAPPRL